MNLNKVLIGGRVCNDTTLKYTPSGTAVCNFSIAVNEKWTDKSGQKQEKAEFVKIVAWGKTGELCDQYLEKGRQALIEGKLQTRSWDDKDGKKCYMTEINAQNVQFIGGSKSDNQGSAIEKDYSIATDDKFTSDTIPF